MPRLGKGRVDYNLAMEPALLQAGKIAAASEDRSLATLLRFLLKQHIERHGDAEAQHIYGTAAGVPHGTPIDRFGRSETLSVQIPGLLLAQAKSQANWEERSLASLVRRSLERYLEECRVEPQEPEAGAAEESLENEAPRNGDGEPAPL